MNFINNKVFDDLLAENYSIGSNRQFDYTFLWLENDNYLINLYAKLLNYLVLQKYISKKFYKYNINKLYDLSEEDMLTTKQDEMLKMDIIRLLQYYILLRESNIEPNQISTKRELKEYIRNNY
jgi:hypothetical protein